jgi:hypothetical protein
LTQPSGPYRRDRWGDVCIVHNWNLLLVEKGLAIYLDPQFEAADYCQQYDLKYGNGLNCPSSTRTVELVRFLFTQEALEDFPTKPTALVTKPRKRTLSP